MDLSSLRKKLIGRKSRASLVYFAFAFLAAIAAQKGWISEEMAQWLIGGGAFPTSANILGIAHEDAASKSNGGG